MHDGNYLLPGFGEKLEAEDWLLELIIQFFDLFV